MEFIAYGNFGDEKEVSDSDPRFNNDFNKFLEWVKQHKNECQGVRLNSDALDNLAKDLCELEIIPDDFFIKE